MAALFPGYVKELKHAGFVRAASTTRSRSAVDRTKVALAALVVVLLTQTIDQEEAIEAIDWNTLGLLAGMMIMVKVTEPTGVYTWLAIRAGQLSRGRPLAVVLALAAPPRCCRRSWTT